MMIRMLIAFLVLLGSVLLGIQLQKDPGYVLITVNHWVIESTLWFTLLSAILLFLLLHITLQVVKKIHHSPTALHHWNARRRARKAQATTRKGLIEYSEGNWHQAKDHLIQALPNTDTPLLNYLTAARAAQKMGDSTLRDHYLREAQQSMPEATLAVELTQAELQLANHQWEHALATLKHLHDIAPRHPYVLKLLMNLYIEIRDWPQLISILPQLKKYHVISQQAFEQVQQDAYLNTLRGLIKQHQTNATNVLFDSLPRALSNNHAIISEYIGFLVQQGEYTKAETLLRRSLRQEFNPKLIELYGQLPGDPRQLEFAESLLKKNSHSASLYLSLGQLCLAQQLWGKAKHYLEQSKELNPTPKAYALLGQLHEKLNNSVLASINYKKGLEAALTGNA